MKKIPIFKTTIDIFKNIFINQQGALGAAALLISAIGGIIFFEYQTFYKLLDYGAFDENLHAVNIENNFELVSLFGRVYGLSLLSVLVAIMFAGVICDAIMNPNKKITISFDHVIFMGKFIVLFLVMMLATIVFSLLIAIMFFILQSATPEIMIFFTFAIIILFSCVFLFIYTRSYVCLADTFADKKTSFKNGWNATKGNSVRLSVITFITALLPGIGLILVLLFIGFSSNPTSEAEVMDIMAKGIYFVKFISFIVMYAITGSLLAISHKFFLSPEDKQEIVIEVSAPSNSQNML